MTVRQSATGIELDHSPVGVMLPFANYISGFNVYDYILNQEEHHKKKTFKEEYLDFLEKFEIGFDEKYLFEWYD